MRLTMTLIISLFLLTSCATVESAWDSTAGAASDAYDWVVGDDEATKKKD